MTEMRAVRIASAWTLALGFAFEADLVAAGEVALAAQADTDSMAAADTASAQADTTLAASADTTAAAGARDLRPASPIPSERPAAPISHPRPWATLVAPGDTLVLDRNEAERTGAHLPFELLGLVPGAFPLEASATAPAGALAIAGSFAAADLTAGGWPVRLPRLEGRDLSRLLFDRLGPGPTLIPLAAPGEIRLTDAIGAPGVPAIRFTPAEPTADSARSRVAVYQGGPLVGGGILFSDRRGRVHYGLGVDNSGSRASGGVDEVSTRLSMIDAGGATSWGRVTLSLRGSEASIDWKNGRRLKVEDQGAVLETVAGDTLGPAWSLRLRVLDDRLSGSEFPGLEFKRKGARIEARWWPHSYLPAWFRISGERDWLAVRFAGGALEPVVDRAEIESGADLVAGVLGRVDVAGSLRASSRHPPRPGGRIAIETPLGRKIGVGAAAIRLYRPPTLDQEALVAGDGRAEPERHDAAELWLTRRAPLGIGLLAARRRLAYQPFISGESNEHPWPVFEFESTTREHWEVRSLLSTPEGPLGLAVSLWGSRFYSAGDAPALPPFVPEAVARGFVTLSSSFLGGNLVVKPRLDGVVVGEYRDFAGQRVGGHARVDGTIVAVVGDRVDLELRLRNMLDRRYPLALLDPDTGELVLDSGRLILVGIRWRLNN